MTFYHDMTILSDKTITEHQNAINRHDHNYSLPAKHADDNGHKFSDWSQTRCAGQTTTKHAREIKEAWHSIQCV